MEKSNFNTNATVERLIDLGDLKVWSLLVTLLGDFAPNPGDSLAGPVLSAIMQRVGIRQEALRVAVHRLRKDGWIESHKTGRISNYSLSNMGRRETFAVRRRVYAPHVASFDQWYMIMTPQDDYNPRSDWIKLLQRCYLSTDLPANKDGQLYVIPLALDNRPDWVKHAALPKNMQISYDTYLAALPDSVPNGPPLDLVVLRMLILHHWRRLVLRHSATAEAFLGQDWTGADCRTRVCGLLRHLPRNMIELLT